MTNGDLRRYGRILREREAELVARLRKRDEITIEKEADELDEGQLARSRDMAIQNLDRDARQLREVQGALHKISEGVYGVCEHCGEEIGTKRLTALPWTRLCIQCQEKMDSSLALGEQEPERGVHRMLDDAA